MFKQINPMTKLNCPTAVLFDTDNTLYDYEPANAAANLAVELKARNLLGVSEEIYHSAFKQARQDIKQRLGHTASSHSRLLYFQRMLEVLGLRAQLLIALDLEQTFWRTFLANAPLFPGVVDLLDTLRHFNIPIAIVTDLTAHVQLRKLTYFRLEETFDAVVTSEEVGADKPDPRNFELALSKLGVPCLPGQIWMIGDNPATDIKGGKAFKAITFQKVHGNIRVGTGDETPDFVFDSFEDFRNKVLSFISDSDIDFEQLTQPYESGNSWKKLEEVS